jgi:membrane associated rhomboid family serine protease
VNREARLGQPGVSCEISVSILRRHPPLKHHATRAHHGEQVAIPGGFRGVSGQGAVGAVVVEETGDINQQRHALRKPVGVAESNVASWIRLGSYACHHSFRRRGSRRVTNRSCERRRESPFCLTLATDAVSRRKGITCASVVADVCHSRPMEDLAGTAVRVSSDRRQVDEWATVVAAGGISYRLRSRLDGWALIVAARDADAAREALDAYDRENSADTTRARGRSVAPVRAAAGVGVAVGLLLIAFFAVTGPRANRSGWFERGSADAERIVAGQWWRTVTALTLHADAPHVVSNATATVVLVGAVGYQFGPGVGLWLVLLAGTGGNLLTAVAHGIHHDSVGASTAMFGAIGILAAAQVMPRERRVVARKRWIVVAASLALLAFLGTSADADLLAHLFGLLVGGGLGLVAVPTLRWSLRPLTQWGLVIAAAAGVVGAWLCAVS